MLRPLLFLMVFAASPAFAQHTPIFAIKDGWSVTWTRQFCELRTSFDNGQSELKIRLHVGAVPEIIILDPPVRMGPRDETWVAFEFDGRIDPVQMNVNGGRGYMVAKPSQRQFDALLDTLKKATFVRLLTPRWNSTHMNRLLREDTAAAIQNFDDCIAWG